MNRYSDYDHFAWFYNKHWSHFSRKVFPVLEQLMLKELPTGAYILDLCCGTGQLVQLLTTHRYKVMGLDGSKEMIGFACKNAPSGKFIVDDARFFKLPNIYNGIISIYDSLNHIMSLEELIFVFHNVYTALQKNGVFLFDLNMEKGYKTRWHDGYFQIVEDNHVCVVQTNYCPEKQVAQFNITMFRSQEEKWRCSELTLVQKCYSVAEVLSALKSVGFKNNRIYTFDEQRGVKNLTHEVGRAFFVCRKPVGK